MLLTCVCGGLRNNESRMPDLAYDVKSGTEGVLRVVLLLNTIGWHILLLAGLYIGIDNFALWQ